MSPAQVTAGEMQLVVFRLDQQRFALALEQVDRVLWRVALAPFPKAPEIVSGLFDLQGELIPAVNVRKRFRLCERAPRLSDHLLLVRTERRRLAFIVDAVESVASIKSTEIASPASLVPGLEYIRGIVQLEAGIVFIQDVDAFLSLEEEALLGAALEDRAT